MNGSPKSDGRRYHPAPSQKPVVTIAHGTTRITVICAPSTSSAPTSTASGTIRFHRAISQTDAVIPSQTLSGDYPVGDGGRQGWKVGRFVLIIVRMNDPTRRTAADLIADLDASEADIEAGRIVPGETVLARIQAALDRYEAEQSYGKHRAAASRR